MINEPVEVIVLIKQEGTLEACGPFNMLKDDADEMIEHIEALVL